MDFVLKRDMINYIWWYEDDELCKMSFDEYWYLKWLSEEDRYDDFLRSLEDWRK